MKKPFWFSATKIVFIAFSFATIILTFLRIIDPKDFVNMVLMILSFYFGQKVMSNKTNTEK